MRILLVFLFINVVSSDINMATKFKVFNPASADDKTGEILCNGRTGVVSQRTKFSEDKNCWDFINFPKSMCIQVSQIMQRNFSVIELQGWDSVQLSESDDCSGEVNLIKKGPCHCKQQVRSPGNQKTNFWKCTVPPFRSVSRSISLDHQIETCTPIDDKVTLMSVDNTKGTDPVPGFFTSGSGVLYE
ncbi:uncharacterized protein LOC118435523 [Folsomia candida]|uniref:Uncharacterized protein n=1 Tax=Folsomia candida TaxID=158441 RepID=A0A226EA68_FOLCA|nr:uncharacterized protein LOC118435523 [Folsomia candida]OXA54435.1 hypothetical protein Fcan01_10516 [Folsomia candida]